MSERKSKNSAAAFGCVLARDVIFAVVLDKLIETDLVSSVFENNAVQALIVSWFGDKAKIMMHLENLPFLWFSHFVSMPPIFPSIFPIACNYFAHKRNNHNASGQ